MQPADTRLKHILNASSHGRQPWNAALLDSRSQTDFLSKKNSAAHAGILHLTARMRSLLDWQDNCSVQKRERGARVRHLDLRGLRLRDVANLDLAALKGHDLGYSHWADRRHSSAIDSRAQRLGAILPCRVHRSSSGVFFSPIALHFRHVNDRGIATA